MFGLSPSLLVAVAATFFLAGAIKGVAGMGLPTVAMGVLGALISPLAAASLLIVPSFVTNIWQLLAGPSVVPLIRRLWPMMLTVVLGTVLGSAWLTSGDIDVTTSALGVVLVLYSGFTLFARQLRVPRSAEWWLSPAIGAVTGMITGATGVFVIPAVPYLQALGFGRDDLVQALGLSFTVSTFALAAALGMRNAFDSGNLIISVLAVLPALAGMWAGQALRRRISPSVFRKGFLLCLLLLGLEMCFAAMR
jgi:hypothetical protein